MKTKIAISRLNDYFSAHNSAHCLSSDWEIIRKELEGNPKNSVEKEVADSPEGRTTDQSLSMLCPNCNSVDFKRVLGNNIFRCNSCTFHWKK